MLRADHRSFFSSNYSLASEDGQHVASIDCEWFREAARVVADGRPFHFFREKLFQSAFALQAGDQTLAKARSAGACERAFHVNAEGRSLQLKAVSCWSSEFRVFEDDVQIGRICPVGWTSQRFTINLPSSVPLVVQVFYSGLCS